MGYRQVGLRHKTLTLVFVGSNPTTPAYGHVAEWFKAAVLKTVDVMSIRGFKSYHVRQSYKVVTLCVKLLKSVIMIG